MYNKNVWLESSQEKEIFAFAEDYKDFISRCKTERLCTKEAVKVLEANGFKELSSFKKLKAGDKVYKTNKDKNVVAFIIGSKDVVSGLRILGAHIDSPRIDLKQNPLYESKGFALLDTHYYGGIKKYQWVTIPLAMYGVVCKKDGSVVDISIGDNENDPILGISDLLIHLAADQMQKKASVVIEGENLDVTCGSIPTKDEKNAVKKNILNILKEKYDITEEDFLSAELEIVPAGPARDYGLDRSMIAGYGHDDRSCAYTSLRALVDIKNPKYTSCALLVDKEEIGSVGATGAQSYFFENVVLEILDKAAEATILNLRKTLENSIMLSSDVSAGVDPLFSEAFEDKNACFLGKGIVFNKYTGARGKSGSNDSMPEYFAWIRNILDNDSVFYQTAELGRVDQGGGGTIAYIFGNTNMNVIDAGIAVLNMHAPMEIVSKADVYEAYKAYKTFLTK